jgi:hypothetical protein
MVIACSERNLCVQKFSLLKGANLILTIGDRHKNIVLPTCVHLMFISIQKASNLGLHAALTPSSAMGTLESKGTLQLMK